MMVIILGSFKTDFLDIIKNKYSFATGRADRSEYWLFQVWVLVICLGFSVPGSLLEDSWPTVSLICDVILIIFCVAVFVPSLCLSVRRLHDIGQSGWLVLLYFLPLVNLIPFFMTFFDSQPGKNNYGPNPNGRKA
jgi:uncharacterized membrane protein YhaH (DUF805 family)